MRIITAVLSIIIFLVVVDIQQSHSTDFKSSVLDMTFNRIPSGSFNMGSSIMTPKDYFQFQKHNRRRIFMGLDPLPLPLTFTSSGGNGTEAYSHESPQHKVTINKDFLIGTHEVTVAQFKLFIQATKRYDLLTDEFMQHNGRGDNMPVVSVSWNDVQDFIDWLNTLEDGHYRLPTEAEWEYAERAGSNSKYFWGNDFSQAYKYAWFNIKATNTSPPKNITHRVGQKSPNSWGLYDISGNAAEWVQDQYSKEYYSKSPETNPEAKIGDFFSNYCRFYYVVRGGGNGYPHMTLRSAFRFHQSPLQRCEYIGFRLCRDID